jgi:fatty-acid desaturase
VYLETHGNLPSMSTELKGLLLAHVAVTLFLTGLIWTIQMVHYPLFRNVGDDAFTAYQTQHMNAITLLVGPAMLIELLTGFLLVGAVSAGSALPFPPLLAWIGLGLIGLVWFSTACINVPQHSQLMLGFDSGVHHALVASNWIRTLAWTARGALVIGMIAGAMR